MLPPLLWCRWRWCCAVGHLQHSFGRPFSRQLSGVMEEGVLMVLRVVSSFLECSSSNIQAQNSIAARLLPYITRPLWHFIADKHLFLYFILYPIIQIIAIPTSFRLLPYPDQITLPRSYRSLPDPDHLDHCHTPPPPRHWRGTPGLQHCSCKYRT